jgi:Type II CAAX prenyl endopeptidase Rce1-like
MSSARLDKRTLFLLASFPSFALEMLNQFWLEPAYELGVGWFYLVDLLQWVATPLLVWFLLLRPSGVMLKDFGLDFSPYRGKLLESSGRFAFVTFLLWIADFPVRHIAYRYLWQYAGTFGYGNAIPASLPWHGLVVVYFAITAGFIEEIVFRGLPWAYLSRTIRGPGLNFWYITLTSLLFAAVHSEQGPHGVIAAFSYGIMTALLYTKLKNLWPLVVGHFVCDLIAFW